MDDKALEEKYAERIAKLIDEGRTQLSLYSVADKSDWNEGGTKEMPAYRFEELFEKVLTQTVKTKGYQINGCLESFPGKYLIGKATTN